MIYRRHLVAEVQGTDRAPLCRSCIAHLNDQAREIEPAPDHNPGHREVVSTHRVTYMTPPYAALDVGHGLLPVPRCRRCDLLGQYRPAHVLCLVEYLIDDVSLVD